MLPVEHRLAREIISNKDEIPFGQPTTGVLLECANAFRRPLEEYKNPTFSSQRGSG